MSVGFFITTSKKGDGDRSRFGTASSRPSPKGQRPITVTPRASAIDRASTTSKMRPYIDMHRVDDAPRLDLPTQQDICALLAICAFVAAVSYGAAGLSTVMIAWRLAQ